MTSLGRLQWKGGLVTFQSPGLRSWECAGTNDCSARIGWVFLVGAREKTATAAMGRMG